MNKKTYKNKVLFNYNLGSKTWFGTGGSCFCFISIESVETLKFIIKFVKKFFPIFIIGNGSNIIVRDGGINGIVLKLGKSFSELKIDKKKLTIDVGAAVKDSEIVKFCSENSVAGFEYLIGIPGTIGGNLKMNAGCYGNEISENFLECEVINEDGEIQIKKTKDVNFSYRNSSFDNDVILTAKFRIRFDKKEKIIKRINEISKNRKKSQPVGMRTGGSTFTNPQNQVAWKLIDKINYRGKKRGGAQVSEHHSNFLINNSYASSLDLELLGEEIKSKIWEKFKIKLRWEIIRIGKFKKI